MHYLVCIIYLWSDLTSTALASKANRRKLLIVVVLRTRPFGKLSRKGATVKKGSNSIWWDNIISGVSVQDEWHENFRMSRETFNYLCIVKYLDFYINRQWREVTITMVWTLAKPYRNSDCKRYRPARFQKFLLWRPFSKVWFRCALSPDMYGRKACPGVRNKMFADTKESRCEQTLKRGVIISQRRWVNV
jgi:hypothetical protein